MGTKLVEEEHKIGFYGLQSNASQYMIPLCLKLNNKFKAFEYLERSKSKAFLDLLSASTLRPSVEMTYELNSLLQEEETYLIKLRGIQIRSSKGMNVEVGLADRIRNELDEIYDKMEKIDPEYVSIRRPRSLSKDNNTIDMTIRHILAAIKKDKGTKYFVGGFGKDDRMMEISGTQMAS